MSNYSPLEVTFVKGEGCWLTDTKGDQYLDALSGIGVVNLGHCHPVITKNLIDQSQQLLHTSNVYRIGNQEKLAKELCTLAKMDKVFFSNSGAEANEAAIKIVRLFARSKDIEKPVILTANQGFHGRTMATLSATGQSKVQSGFAPLMSEFIPIGACLAKGVASKMLTPGTHGSTFGGNPLVTSAALGVLDVFQNTNVLENVNKMSEYFRSEFDNKIKNNIAVKELRIKGLMIGIGLDSNIIDCSQLVKKALKDNLLINVTGTTIRMLPPLIITKEEIDILISKLIKLIST